MGEKNVWGKSLHSYPNKIWFPDQKKKMYILKSCLNTLIET